MESNKTFWIIILIVTVMVESKSVPLRDPYVARALLSVSPPSNPPSSSPAPGPEVENTFAIPASYIDSPLPSPGAPADSFAPANAPTTRSPSPSPEAPANANAPTTDSPSPSPEAHANAPTTDSPSPSPEAHANAPTTDSPSPSPEAPANAPTTDSPSPSPEADMDDYPSLSPEAPADSTFPANPPTEMDIDSPSPSPEENPEAPSDKTLMTSATTLLKETMLPPEIKTICGKTDNPALCESSIGPLLTAAVKPDASSILVLAIQASINATKAAKPAVDKTGAADCQELYDDAVANLEDAINAFKESDIATVNVNLSAAITDYVTCNDGFEESGEPNPLADVAGKLRKMVSNCLAISSLIK